MTSEKKEEQTHGSVKKKKKNRRICVIYLAVTFQPDIMA
jgi:hypothetical protein